MEKTNGENILSKAEKKENRVSYSVETPYGFHLDLDFLKYVHDIEKGNTIKRIHIQRRAKQAKFSTLPRNFSVPDSGSQSYSASSTKTWSPSSYRADTKEGHGCPGGDSSLRLRYIHELNYRRKDNICEAPLRELTPEDFSSFRERPQFGRTSSLPASLPLSTTSLDQTQYLTSPQPTSSFSESRLEFFKASVSPRHAYSDDQIASAFIRIKELEEQLKRIPELQQTISVLEGENRELNAQIQLLSQLLNNLKEQETAAELNIIQSKGKAEDVAVGNGECDVHEESSLADLNNSQFSAIKQQVIDLTEQLDDHTKEVHNLRVLVEKQSNELKAKDVYIGDLTSMIEQTEKARPPELDIHYRDMAVNTEELQSEDKSTSANISVETRSMGCGVLPRDLNQPLDEPCTSSLASDLSIKTDDNVLMDHTTVFGELETEKVTKTDAKEGNVEDTLSDSQIYPTQVCEIKAVCSKEDPADLKPCPTDHPPHTDASIGQYVKRIQDLLQEQWTCLEHGYPDLASAIKQPASKLSSIQNQLVNSLNSLSSVYSIQTTSNKESMRTESHQGESSPGSLKSIMKKKTTNSCRSGPISESRAKKNLQFVGVNGGYETTSSEDSSSSEEFVDDHGEQTAIVTCAQDDDNGHTEATVIENAVTTEEELQETSDATASEAQPNLHRCTMGDAFRSECQLLNSHLSELRTTTDNTLRQTLYTVCQEWFRVSSQKTSSPDLVSDYLQEFRSVSPSLLQMVVNIADENGNTALHYSVSHSNFRIVQLLLSTGVCDVDHQNKAGYTPVMLTPLASPETDEDMEVVKALLSLGDVNLCATQGCQTALMIGVSHARSDMVKVLLDCGANVNLTDEDGESALMVACQIGNTEIVKLLLSCPDCDVQLQDKAGNTALSIVTDSACSEIAELLQAHADQQGCRPTSGKEKEGSL